MSQSYWLSSTHVQRTRRILSRDKSCFRFHPSGFLCWNSRNSCYVAAASTFLTCSLLSGYSAYILYDIRTFQKRYQAFKSDAEKTKLIGLRNSPLASQTAVEQHLYTAELERSLFISVLCMCAVVILAAAVLIKGVQEKNRVLFLYWLISLWPLHVLTASTFMIDCKFIVSLKSFSFFLFQKYLIKK